MPNEGPIKNSLQRQRLPGREEHPATATHPLTPHPNPCHYHRRDSFCEQNILKVNSRGSPKNTHSAPNECSIFDSLSSFSAISTPELVGVFPSENLMEMDGEEKGGIANTDP